MQGFYRGCIGFRIWGCGIIGVIWLTVYRVVESFRHKEQLLHSKNEIEKEVKIGLQGL